MQLISSRRFFAFITLYRCLTNCHGHNCVCLCVNWNIIATLVRGAKAKPYVAVASYAHTDVYMCISFSFSLSPFRWVHFGISSNIVTFQIGYFSPVSIHTSNGSLISVSFPSAIGVRLTFLVNQYWLILLALELSRTHQLSSLDIHIVTKTCKFYKILLEK